MAVEGIAMQPDVGATDASGQPFTCRVFVIPIAGHEPETAAMLVMERREGALW